MARSTVTGLGPVGSVVAFAGDGLVVVVAATHLVGTLVPRKGSPVTVSVVGCLVGLSGIFLIAALSDLDPSIKAVLIASVGVLEVLRLLFVVVDVAPNVRTRKVTLMQAAT